MNIIPEKNPVGTGDWPGIEDAAGLLAARLGAWNHFGYPAPVDGQAAIPPPGERSADAIKAGHGAVEVIDEIGRELYRLREQLVGELCADSDARAARVDAMLAETRARQQAVPMARASDPEAYPGGIGDPVNIGIQSGGRIPEGRAQEAAQSRLRPYTG
jgi:hypothetical protein